MDINYQNISNSYGTNITKLCIKKFPNLNSEILYKILKDNFNSNLDLYEDLITNNKLDNFINYLENKINKTKENNLNSLTEYLNELDYKIETNKENIKEYKKYLNKDTYLLNDYILNSCQTFILAKKDFKTTNKKNMDLYNNSIIIINILNNEITIKNRSGLTSYNNNLNLIKNGLKNSFEKEFNINIKDTNKDLELPGYIKINNKYYKYNYNINNIYYCSNNIIINNNKIINCTNCILIDYFILDLENKQIYLYDETINDSFINDIENINDIQIKNNTIKIIYNINKELKITLDKNNKIINYENNYIDSLGDNFLFYNNSLTNIKLNNIKKIGNNFLYNNNKLENIEFNKLLLIGHNFLYNNEVISKIDISNVESILNNFLQSNKVLVHIDLNKCIYIGDNFLLQNKVLNNIKLNNINYINNNFLYSNKKLEEIILPNVKTIKNNFLGNNTTITKIEANNLNNVGNYFLFSNNKLSSIYFDNLENIGDYFLTNNNNIKEINLNKINNIGNYFLSNNKIIEIINIPPIIKVGKYFLYSLNPLKNNKPLTKKLLQK